jgi:hypothetical protein
MPQYKLVFKSQDGEHVYIRHGRNQQHAEDFIPLRIVGDNFDDPVPFECDLVSAEEMEIWIVFQLDSKSYPEVERMARYQGLHAEKAEGSYCLKVQGKGDWIFSRWVRDYKQLSSNWI